MMERDISMPSLKQFHMIFISISVILCMFFGYWSYNHSLMYYLSLSIISMIGLIVYGTVFYKKSSEF